MTVAFFGVTKSGVHVYIYYFDYAYILYLWPYKRTFTKPRETHLYLDIPPVLCISYKTHTSKGNFANKTIIAPSPLTRVKEIYKNNDKIHSHTYMSMKYGWLSLSVGGRVNLWVGVSTSGWACRPVGGRGQWAVDHSSKLQVSESSPCGLFPPRYYLRR